MSCGPPPLPNVASAPFAGLVMAALTHTQEMTAAIIRRTSKLYSYQLPGATLLVPALLIGCMHVLHEGGAHTPRSEALVLLGSILHHVDSEEHRVSPGTHGLEAGAGG